MVDNPDLRYQIMTNKELTGDETSVLIEHSATGSDPWETWFFGYIRDTVVIEATETRVQDIKIQLVDPGFLLKKKVRNTAVYISDKICDPADTGNSILHKIMAACGLSSNISASIPTVSQVIPYFILKKDSTYWDLLHSVLSVYCYVFNFEADGKINIYDLAPADLTTTNAFDNTNMQGEIKQIKTNKKADGVRVNWYTQKTDTGVIVFSDTSGGNTVYKCVITISPDEYYPVNSDVNDYFSDYKYGDKNLLCVLNPTLDAVYNTGIVIATENLNELQAQIVFHNDTLAEKSITKFDITGDAVYEGDKVVTEILNSVDADQVETINAEYIQSEAIAIKYGSMLSQWYRYANINYEVYSNTDIASPVDYYINDLVDMAETVIGLDVAQTCRIVQIYEKVVLAINNREIAERRYTIEGMAEYTAMSAVHEYHQEPAQPETIVPVNLTETQDAAVAEAVPAAVAQTFSDIQSGFPIGYWGVGTYASPEEGDNMCYIDSNQLYFAEYTAGSWSTVGKCRIGFINIAFVAALFGCVLANPAAAIDEELLPTSRHLVFNFENNYEDQDGVDDWDTKTNLAFSNTVNKFGSYSLFATAGNSGLLNRSTNRLATVGENQSIGVWVRVNITNGGGDPANYFNVAGLFFNQLVPVSTSYIYIYGYKTENSNTFKFAAGIQKNTSGGATVIIDTEESSADTFHYVSAHYNSATDKLILTIDNRKIESDAIGGSWLSGIFEFEMYTNNAFVNDGYTLSTYLDEGLYYYNEAVDPDIFVQHYNHDLPWSTEYSQADVALIPATEADRVYVKGHLKVKNAGGLVAYGDTEAAVTVVNANPSGTSWTEVDVSAYVSANAKAVLLYCRIAASTVGRTLYLSDADSGKLWGALKNFSTSVSGFGQYKVYLSADKSFFYQVDNADVSAVEIALLEYYE